jgi:hypothetical protein
MNVKFIVMKSSRSPVTGLATKADAYRGVVYPTEKIAQKAADAFSRYNPVGFRVIGVSDG